MTQWRDERDKGERDREITRWWEETVAIMDLKSYRKILSADIKGHAHGKFISLKGTQQEGTEAKGKVKCKRKCTLD